MNRYEKHLWEQGKSAFPQPSHPRLIPTASIGEIRRLYGARYALFVGARRERRAAPSLPESLLDRQILRRLATLQSRKGTLAAYLPDSGYSMGEIRALRVELPSGQIATASRYDNTRRYKGRYAGSERHGYVQYTLSWRDAMRLDVIGGLLTAVGNRVEPGIRAAHWISQAHVGRRKYGSELEPGYLTNAGYHTRKLERAREMTLKAIHARGELSPGASARRARNQLHANLDSLLPEETVVTVADAHRAGFCQPGIQAWINRAGLTATEAYPWSTVVDGFRRAGQLDLAPALARAVQSR